MKGMVGNRGVWRGGGYIGSLESIALQLRVRNTIATQYKSIVLAGSR